MTAMRDHLAAELARKVSQKGLVVWQDSERAYVEVAESLCPPEARFVAYEGSWYALRRAVEPFLAADVPPKMVIYASARAPQEDPLEELRAAGGAYTRRLSTLAKDALAGQLSEQRVAEIGSKARTLLEAEAAIAGDPGGDVRLIGLLGASDARTMALRILTGQRSAELDSAAAWPAAAELLSNQLGGKLTGSGDDLRRAALRQMVLTEIAGALDGLPDALASAWGSVSAEQRRRTTDLLIAWRTDPAYRGDYGAVARQVDEELGLASVLDWADGLSDCVATPAIEDLALAEAVRQLEAGEATAASALAEPAAPDKPVAAAPGTGRRGLGHNGPAVARGTSHGRAPEVCSARTRRPRPARLGRCSRGTSRKAGRSTGRTAGSRWPGTTCASSEPSSRRSPPPDSHTNSGSTPPCTRSPRRSSPGDLTSAPSSGREISTPNGCATLRARSRTSGSMRSASNSAPICATACGLTARQLSCTRLWRQRRPSRPSAWLTSHPGPARGCRSTLDGGDLAIRVGGVKVATVADRVALLRAAHGDKVLDRTLDAVAGQGEKELKRALGDADLLLVRSQELDSAGESGMLNAAWSQFSAVLEMLRNLVARLGQAGVRRIVITADHGFVTLSRALGPDRAIDPPAGGTGDLHRRGWVGKGASTTPSTLRVAVASTGDAE